MGTGPGRSGPAPSGRVTEAIDAAIRAAPTIASYAASAIRIIRGDSEAFGSPVAAARVRCMMLFLLGAVFLPSAYRALKPPSTVTTLPVL
jgi:hypothetical protein